MGTAIKSYIHNSLFILLIITFAVTNKIHASTIPTFPTCLNPQGEMKVQHLNGTHGVAGDENTYTGIDSVYYLTEDTLMQCLCQTDGNGIQTNWWNVSQLSGEEITELKNQGWIYIADGSAWGLDEGPYLAKNSSYSCIGGKGGGDNSNSGSSSSSSSSNSNNSSSSQGGGDTSTGTGGGQILGLASTGNITTIYLLFTIGISLLISGIYIQRVRPNKHE